MERVTMTCGEYRSGRRLLALKLQLEEDQRLDPRRRVEIEAEVARLEQELGMD